MEKAPVLNPATGQVAGEIPIYTRDDVAAAVTEAREAQAQQRKDRDGGEAKLSKPDHDGDTVGELRVQGTERAPCSQLD